MASEGQDRYQEKPIPFSGASERVKTKRRNSELSSGFASLKLSAHALMVDLDEQAWHLAQLFACAAELKDRGTSYCCPAVSEISDSLHAFVEQLTTLTVNDVAVIERHLEALHEALVDVGAARDSESTGS